MESTQTNNNNGGAQSWHFAINGTRPENTIFTFTMSIGNEGPQIGAETPSKAESTKTLKRPYSLIQDIPTPPHSSPPGQDNSLEDLAPQYFDDDRNLDFELIRVPKVRSYDLVQVPKTSPKARDEANVPLTATRRDGTDVCMWAKMDTGADTNFINLSTLQKLLGQERAEKEMYPLGDDEPVYNLVGANHIDFTHRVNLSFRAGKSNKLFKDISFVVYPDVDTLGSSTDGVPNVIIGIQTLKEHHMVMVDFEYHDDRDPTLEVISPKAETENPEFRTIGPIIKGPKAPGIRMHK